MCKTLLGRIHAGDYQPAIKIDKGRKGYEEYWKAADMAVGLYEKFRKELTGEQQERLDKLLDAQVEITNVANRDHYVEGAKFGAKMILELLGIELSERNLGGEE